MTRHSLSVTVWPKKRPAARARIDWNGVSSSAAQTGSVRQERRPPAGASMKRGTEEQAQPRGCHP